MKKFLCIVLAVLFVAALSGCNKQVVDLTFKYDRAVLCLPNGEVVDGKIESWRDYEDGDQIQVKIDGNIYLVHSADIALIQEK